MSFNNTMRAHRDLSGNTFKAPAQNNRMRLRLEVSNGTVADETLLYFDNNALNSFDNYDSQKFFNTTSSSQLEIFTKVGNERLAINGMKELAYDTEIPLGFVTHVAGDFSILCKAFSNFEAGTRLFIKDALNPSMPVELSESLSYNFSAGKTSVSDNRFSLIFSASGDVSGNVITEQNHVRVYVNADKQITIIAPEKSNYAIFNAIGQFIVHGKLNSEQITVNSKLYPGIYIVKVNEITSRVIVN